MTKGFLDMIYFMIFIIIVNSIKHYPPPPPSKSIWTTEDAGGHKACFKQTLHKLQAYSQQKPLNSDLNSHKIKKSLVFICAHSFCTQKRADGVQILCVIEQNSKFLKVQFFNFLTKLELIFSVKLTISSLYDFLFKRYAVQKIHMHSTKRPTICIF